MLAPPLLLLLQRLAKALGGRWPAALLGPVPLTMAMVLLLPLLLLFPVLRLLCRAGMVIRGACRM